jgi:hypothetical protein
MDPDYERQRYWAPFAEYPPAGKGGDDLDREIGERHAKVSEIIARGLERIRLEIQDLYPDLANIDYAGDGAEIMRQVSHNLMVQLRAFASGMRRKKAELGFDVDC